MKFLGTDYGFGRDRAEASLFELGEDGCYSLIETAAPRRPAWRDRILRQNAVLDLYRHFPPAGRERRRRKYRRACWRLSITCFLSLAAFAYSLFLYWEASR